MLLAWLVLISGVVLLPVAIWSRIAANQVYKYVREQYPDYWQTLHTPTKPKENSPFFSKRGSFILKQHYLELKDPVLAKKGRLALIAFQSMVGILIIFTLSAITYQILN